MPSLPGFVNVECHGAPTDRADPSPAWPDRRADAAPTAERRRRTGGLDHVGATMWAIRKLRSEPGLALEETPVPSCGDDDVLVRVEAASLCGTDLHIFHWDDWAAHRIRPPLTLGHEFAGTVVEIGRNVRHTAPGDYVSAESHVTCGMCFECRTGRAHMCERTQILGVDRDGAFAEYVAVPESVVWLNDRAKLPPEIATLQEPFGNAVFAAGLHDLAGRTVAVLGAGRSGSSASRSRAPREPGACSPPIASPSGWSWRGRWG